MMKRWCLVWAVMGLVLGWYWAEMRRRRAWRRALAQEAVQRAREQAWAWEVAA